MKCGKAACWGHEPDPVPFSLSEVIDLLQLSWSSSSLLPEDIRPIPSFLTQFPACEAFLFSLYTLVLNWHLGETVQLTKPAENYSHLFFSGWLLCWFWELNWFRKESDDHEIWQRTRGMILGDRRPRALSYSFTLSERESLLCVNKMRNSLSFLPHRVVV